jgi:DNA-binding CsgD family transcriptional regulator
MSQLERFIADTNAAATADEVFKHFEAALRSYGYDRICYSLITDHPSLGLLAGHGVMRNYSDDWMAHYQQNGYEKLDPVPQYCFATARPFTWDWLTKSIDLPAPARQVMQEAQEAKLLDGLAIPLYGVNGELAGVGLASSAGGTEMDRNAISTIRAIAYQFHMAYTEKDAQGDPLQGTALTPREKEILLWAAEGKSDPVIADIVGISYPTVRFHMSNIFRKLNAYERTLAVAKAIRQGLILPSYVEALTDPIRVAR